jgi:transcriptional regulator with XRE-family HTH domain
MIRSSAAHQFGVAVRLYRRKHGLTQQQLAARIGCPTVSYISQIEAGRKNLTLHQCEKIASAFKLPVSVFFDEVIDAPTSRTPTTR